MARCDSVPRLPRPSALVAASAPAPAGTPAPVRKKQDYGDHYGERDDGDHRPADSVARTASVLFRAIGSHQCWLTWKHATSYWETEFGFLEFCGWVPA